MNYNRIFYFCFIIFFVFLFSLAAGAENIKDWNTELGKGVEQTQIYDTKSADPTAVQIAKYAGAIMAVGAFISVYFLIQMVLSGYEWMTAQGNEETIAKAQKRIVYAVVGLIIMVGMYMISSFFITKLGGVTGYKIGE